MAASETSPFIEEGKMNTGKVKLYKNDEGYGVITPDDGSRDIIFREIRCIGIEELAEGRRVSYQVQLSKPDDQAEAIDVVVL